MVNVSHGRLQFYPFYGAFYHVLPPFTTFYHVSTMHINASTTGSTTGSTTFPRVLAILLREARLEAVAEHLLGAGKVVTKLGQLTQLVDAKENPPGSESPEYRPGRQTSRNRWGKRW